VYNYLQPFYGVTKRGAKFQRTIIFGKVSTFCHIRMAVFDQRKRGILHGLQSDEPDLSPKGAPDAEILELLQLINSHSDFVSTSSCSGRAVVFLDADKAAKGSDTKGRWLMNRHSPLNEPSQDCAMESLFGILFGDTKIGRGWERGKEGSRRLVTLKFEPLVWQLSKWL
jgi:tRNA wybutosine-synthesizing protein 3